MRIRTQWTLAALVVGAMLGMMPATVVAADLSDTSIQYLYGNHFHDSNIPFNRNLLAVDITKNIINLSHVDTYKYGGNASSIDFRTSNGNDPANNSPPAPRTSTQYFGAISVSAK